MPDLLGCRKRRTQGKGERWLGRRKMPVAGTRCTHREGISAWSGCSGRVMVVSLPSHKDRSRARQEGQAQARYLRAVSALGKQVSDTIVRMLQL